VGRNSIHFIFFQSECFLFTGIVFSVFQKIKEYWIKFKAYQTWKFSTLSALHSMAIQKGRANRLVRYFWLNYINANQPFQIKGENT
jgi:hypothetical protein